MANSNESLVESSAWQMYINAQRHLPIKVIEANKDKMKIVYQHPGLSFESYDAFGKPSLFNLIYLNNAIHFYAFNNSYDNQGNMFFFSMMDYLQNMDITFFAANLHLLCYKELYDISVSKWNMRIEMQTFAKSTRHISFKCDFLSHDQRQLLASAVFSIFPVKISQRKSAPIDAELHQLFPENAKLSAHRVLDVPRPKDAYCFRSTVMYHEIDSHHHMAAMHYYNHVMNAIYSAVAKGDVFGNLTRERFRRGVSSFEMVHLKECLLDDLLDVFVWEIPNHGVGYRDKLKDIFVSPSSNDHGDEALSTGSANGTIHGTETDSAVIMCVMEVNGKSCLRALVQFFK